MMRVLLFLAAVVGASSSLTKDTIVPTFRLTELSAPFNSELLQTLQTSGILAIRMEDEAFLSHHRHVGLGGLCECYDRPEFKELDGADSVRMRKSTTTRTTLATATFGSKHPFDLPKEALEQVCGADTVHSLDALRDTVAVASQAFVRALDDHLETPRASGFDEHLLATSHGREFESVRAIVDAAQNLEHFHVYDKDDDTIDTNTAPTLDFHTDAGLFLAFIPALTCNGGETTDRSLVIKDDIDGTPKRVVFHDASNTVVIMLGVGAQNWLRTRLSLKATIHSVQMKPGQVRAWYGMMHLVPQDAIIQETPRRQTFADMRNALVLARQRATTREYGDNRKSEEEEISLGCGGTQEELAAPSDRSSISYGRRRRLQHVDDASVCNNSTNFYCWMTCLDIPNAGEALEYKALGYSLYCAEPTVVSGGSTIGAAVEKCSEDGVAGLAMNSNCVGYWHPTTDGVPSQDVKLVFASDGPIGDDPFCYGGTSMYMDGFNWVGSTCAIYLFPTWILNTPWKLALACIGTIFFGIFLEWVISRRRAVMKAIDGDGSSWYYRLVVSSSFYGLQLTTGYLLMLVVMIYSGPLFLSVVLGLVGGHLLFNAKDALWGTAVRGESKKIPIRQQDCCSPESRATTDKDCEATLSTVGDSRNMNSKGPEKTHGTCCQDGDRSDDEDSNSGVPEGSTPCCQNTL